MKKSNTITVSRSILIAKLQRLLTYIDGEDNIYQTREAIKDLILEVQKA